MDQNFFSGMRVFPGFFWSFPLFSRQQNRVIFPGGPPHGVSRCALIFVSFFLANVFPTGFLVWNRGSGPVLQVVFFFFFFSCAAVFFWGGFPGSSVPLSSHSFFPFLRSRESLSPTPLFFSDGNFLVPSAVVAIELFLR